MITIFKDGYNTLSGFCKLRKAWKNGGPKEKWEEGLNFLRGLKASTEDNQVCFDSKELIFIYEIVALCRLKQLLFSL